MFWPIGLGGDFWNDAGDDVFCESGVCVEVVDHGSDVDCGFVGFPAIVIGDETERGESDFGFAAEAGFWCVGHADEVEAHVAVHVGFGAGGESRAAHGNVSPAVVKSCGVIGGGLDEKSSHLIAVGIGEGNVGCDAISEKRKLM